MDNTVNNLLQSAISPGKTEDKKQSVLEQSLRKSQDVLGEIEKFNPLGLAATNVTGGGSSSQNLLEIDMSTLSNNEIRQRYGEYGNYLIQQRDSGVSDYLRNASAYRTDAQAIGDSALDVGMGVGSLAHLAPLAMELSNSPLGSAIAPSLGPLGTAVSALPDSASVATSEAINAAFDWAQGIQSDPLQRSRENYQARQFGDARDNRMDYGADGLMNTLKRVGSDALDAVENTVEDPSLVLSGLSQAGGSLIAGGMLGRGVGAATSRLPGAQKIVEAASKAKEAGKWSGARAAHALGQNAATGSVIAGMETGGVYSDTVSRIMEMSHEQLLETSAYYRKALEMMGDPERAKESTARAAARRASSQMAPVAAATGLIAGRFESSPLARRGVRSAAQNIGLETVEESVQGTAAPLTTNLAVRDFADPSVDVEEGVGEGTGLGALYGMGIATTLQAPGVAAQKVYDGAKYVGGKLTARIDAVEQEIKNSSPVSTAQLAPVATELNTNIAQAQETLNEAVSTLPPEQQEQASEYINSLVSLGSFTEGQYQNPILDAVTQGATSKLDALQRIGEMIANPEVDAESRVLGALEILLTQDATLIATSHNTQAYEQLSDDSLAAQVVSGILGVTQQILNNPEVKDAVEVAVKILQESPPTIAPVTPESINTPEGQQNIDLAVKVAQVAPEKGNLEANQQILYHANNGDISLTPAQMQALEISNALIQAERNSQALGNTLKLSEDALRVNREITLEGDNRGPSIAEHARGIYHALLNNDQEAATQRVVEMGNFAKHMLNKADALNQHIQAGPTSPRVGYDAWNPTARIWFKVEGTKEQGMFLRPNSKVSMDLAKTVFHEASLAADVYNNMVDAVGMGTKVTPPSIPQIIAGTPAPTRAAPTTSERIPTALHRDIADALGVSITRVRAYSKGQNNALTDDQIQQTEYLIEGVEGITPTQSGDTVEVTQTPVMEPVGKEANPFFPNSVVPGIVYHATQEDPETFEVQAERARPLGVVFVGSSSDKLVGFYLTKDAEYAKGMQPGGNLMQFYVDIQNPYLVTDDSDITLTGITPEERDRLVKEGYDGVMYADPDSRFDDFVVFSSDQVKRVNQESVEESGKDTTTSPVPVTSSVSAAQAKKLSDPELNDQLNKLLDIPESDRSPVETATLDVLDAEMNAREEQADIESSRQEEEENQEPVQDTTPIEEPKSVVEAPQTETETPVVPLTGLASVFQKLVGVVEGTNLFVRSFKYPKNQRTRLVGEEQPIQAVLDILNDSESLTDTLGSKWTSRVDDRVLGSWKALLNRSQAISRDVAKMFDAAINREKVTTNRKTKVRKANPSLLAQLKSGKPVNKYTTGLLFNIAEFFTTNKGRETAVLNPELLQLASLAMTDWVINSSSNREILDQGKALETANGMLKTNAISISPEAHTMLNEGTTPEAAIRDLGSKITKYWGLQEDANGFIGDQQGIPQSLARMFIEDLIQKGHVTSNYYVMGEVDGVISLIKGAPQAGQISVIKWSLDEGKILDLPEDHVENITKTRTLIEEIVSLDPEVTYYVGDDAMPPVAQHQLRQSLVPLTRQQKAVLKKANATEYRIDPMMVSLFGLIGKDQLVEYFGGQDTTDEHLFNKNHLKSVEGQRRGISAAYDALQNLLLEIGSIAVAEGKAPEDVAVRFKHEFASVNRLFLQGPYNPQSSKLMRDALLPTWTVADMTQQKNQDFLYLALAQGLDISIHKQAHGDSIQQVSELLTADQTSRGKPTLKAAIPLVQKMIDQADRSKLLDQTDGVSLDQIKGIFDDAGIPFNFLALKSLMEYVNFTRAEDLTQFKSSMYIEADGMTNGPANAMMLFNSGSFTEHWVENMERVGYYINQPDATANSKNPGLHDMYQTGANAFVSAIEAHKASLNADWKRASVDNLHRLISMFDPDFGFNDKDELSVGRGFLKNPLMVMIYGSGASGVANSITSALLDSVYERISEALHRQAENPGMDFAEAMFPDSANPNQEFGVFQARFGSAIGRKNFRLTDPVNFTLPSEQKRKLQTNVKFNLVDSMYAAIQETVGDTVFSNVDTMKTAISHMSDYAAVLQKQLIQRQTQLYKENEEGYTSRQLLKKKDLAEIEEKLKRVSAYIEAAHQNFLVTDQGTYPVAETTSEGFHSNSARISGTVPGFAGAGVAGVAYMNQGSGDAQMVQFGYANGGSEMSRVMPAFDGMHFPFTDMEAGGNTMNTAVAESWKLNPMQAVSDAFSRFMEEVNQDLLTDVQKLDFPDMREALKSLAAEIQKNHDVLDMVPSTIDQMAGTGATHQNQGTEFIVSTDIEGITEQLNALRDDIKEDVAPATIRELIAPKGRPVTWVQTIYANALPKFLEGNFLNQDQKHVLQDVLNGKYLRDWEINIGSPRSLKDLVRRRGIGTPQLREALNSGQGGFTIPGSKQIFIMNDSAETVLHEVIHATTFQKVLDHVEGRTNNVAVERIQGMMNQFMELTADDYGHLATTAIQASTLQRVIREARKQGNEAVAINEFMAWTLSNRQLTELAKKQTLPKVLQIAKDAWAMLKELIFGKKFAPSVGSDMYSNLRFNTALIIQTNLNVAELSSTGPTLYHETSRVDPDLQKLDQALQRVVVDQLRMRDGANAEATDLSRELIISEQAADAVASAFFDMTAEEVEVFKTTVQALTVEQNLDRNVTREANRLYSQVIKDLKVEDFMPEDADPSERAYANAKYSLIAGSSFNEIDGAGRSTILPVFFGLAMTSREFKDVLSRMQMPKGVVSEETGVDGVLENFGYKSIEALGSKLAGTGTATNIQQAMNILGNKIIENQEARENRFETPGRWIDKVNDVVVERANNFANALSPTLTEAEKAQRTKWDKGLDGAKSALALLISEDIGARAAEDATAAIDARANLHHWFRELAADITGRTKGNALIYDMIKQVRSTIQAIRQNYRVNLPKHLKKQFTRSLTETELASIHRGVIKSDLGKLRLLKHSKQDIALWASNESARKSEIKRLEDSLAVSKNASTWVEKSKQLAHWMNTGENGINLLRNAEAIVDLLGTGEKLQLAEGQTRESVLTDIDTLVSLYSIDTLDQVDKDNLSSLVQTEPKGMDYIFSYMGDILKTEQERITPESKYNAYKGFAPFSQKPNTSLVVGHETQHADLIAKGYVKVGVFVGANAYLSRGQAYYSMPASAKAAFNQGIIQTAKATTFGVDPSTGYSIGYVVNRITDPVQMKRMLQRQDPANPLIPIYDGEGQLRAVEQVMEPRMLNTVQDVQDATETIGKWKGRQEEEILSQEVNKALIDRLKAQLDADPNKDRYENVFKSTDPVIRDAVANIPAETRAYIEKVFGKEFLVQRNMLRDVLGYRDASIRDSWTGVTRMPQSTQTAIRKMATLIMGKDAYRNMVRAEEIIENLASNAKVLIAIKSGIVPALNIVSNLVHLVSRGVPINQMRKGIPRKLAEIKEYTQSRIKMMELEADYAAATMPNQRASIQAQMQAIEDGHRRLSIWPLIEAGEFTAISDVDLRDADTRITSGKWAEYFDETVAKMPPGFSTAGRYFLVSKDTALFNGMQKAVEYGDLVAKSILYDDLVSRGQKTKEEALGIITEEFVNYDRLPGRARGKLEKVGLMWFYNFKLRSVKVALSTMRNNPVHTLLALAVPTDFGVGDAGIPVEDNAVTMGLEGRLGNSIGPGQGIRAPSLNPWLNFIE